MDQNGFNWILNVLAKLLEQLTAEIINLMPRLFLTIIIFIAAALIVKITNAILNRLLRFANINELIKTFTGVDFPFSIGKLIVYLADLGIVLIALYGVFSLILEPRHMSMVNEAVTYGTKVLSVTIIILFVFSGFNAFINKIKVETKLRGYFLFILLLMSTALLIDITSLSDPVKNALVTGLSIGIGVSIGVFAAWFFFKEYMDKMIEFKEKQQVRKENEVSES